MAFKPPDEPFVNGQHRVGLGAGVAEQHVLVVVVAQHVGGHVVGHLREELVALLLRQVA